MSKASEYAEKAREYPFLVMRDCELRVGRNGGLLIYREGREVAEIWAQETPKTIKWLRETFED